MPTYVNAAMTSGLIKTAEKAAKTGTGSEGNVPQLNASGKIPSQLMSTGIHLGGTDAANLLDDYEEGTWTISVTDGTNAMTMFPGGWDTGYYVKVGKMVTVTGYVRTSSVGSASGDIKITGLPFSSDTGNTIGTASSTGFGRATGMSLTAGHVVGGFIGASSNEIQLRVWDDSGGTTVMQASEFSTGILAISMTYRSA